MLSKANRSAATLTTTRVDPAPESGICVTCLDGCEGPCEIGRSALRGREVLYPCPFGKVTAGAEKTYPVNFSHFNIQGTCVGAVGCEADSDKATFPSVRYATTLGKWPLKVPVFTGALGSTDIAREQWDGLAVGAAICGTVVVVGENVCGMDPAAEIKNGRVVRSPEMERRVAVFKRWYDGRHGGIIVQANVEDGRLGVPDYVIEKLGIECFELKWGQGAKNIGGEVKLPNLTRALQLKERGYIVLPDPTSAGVQEQFKLGGISGFERHSRLGMVVEEDFYKSAEHLRKVGAKMVSLKTGAYRPVDLARAVKFCSNAKVDVLTVDGAGGGTGMSPWRMMNEWGIPTVYLESLLYRYLKRIEAKGGHIPSVAVAGGLSLEDHVFKAIALGAPYIKAICLGRAIMTAAMVGNTHGKLLKEKVELSGGDLGEGLLQLFSGAVALKERFGKDFEKLPPGAIGMYTYMERLMQGLQQLMAGARKFALNYIERGDLVALTKEAAKVSGIDYVMEADEEEAERILDA
jgi:glutamate synthase domain-containing protein 2